MTVAITDANRHLDLISSVVDRIWPDATWTSEPLDDGMTNRNFKVTVTPVGQPDRVVVIQEQLPAAQAAEIGILRDNQMRIWPQMTAIGLAPELLRSFDDLGVTVVEFVSGTRLSDVTDRRLAIRLTAQTLRRLHDTTQGDATPGLVSDPFDGMAWLAARIREQNPAMVENFRWTLDLVDRIRSARGPYEACQVHTDATHVNIILAPDGERVTLLDWEYVGAGDRYMDLGHFAARTELSAAEEKFLIQSYDPSGDNRRSLAIVRVYRFISMLREGLWSALADGIDFLDEFDHAQYAHECLDNMATTTKSEEFIEALETLEHTVPATD
jgi:thiamine kinase-like enzyme